MIGYKCVQLYLSKIRSIVMTTSLLLSQWMVDILYGVSRRQNIYSTWLTNTNVGYQKHAQPPFFYHIPLSHSNITFLHLILVFYVATLATLSKICQMVVFACSMLVFFIFGYSMYSVVFMLMRFRLYNLVSSSILLLDTKLICHYMQLSCQESGYCLFTLLHVSVSRVEFDVI